MHLYEIEFAKGEYCWYSAETEEAALAKYREPLKPEDQEIESIREMGDDEELSHQDEDGIVSVSLAGDLAKKGEILWDAHYC